MTIIQKSMKTIERKIMGKRQKRKGGFTLVELIVILTILAILAGLLIPALTGYIDKAKQKKIVAEIRMLQTAVQTEAVEFYAEHSADLQGGIVILASSSGASVVPYDGVLTETERKKNYESVIKLSEIPGLQNGKGHFTAIINKKGKVHLILYNNGAGYLGIYFHETGEYLVYKLSSGVSDKDFGTYENKVCYFNETEHPDSTWSKTAVLGMLGITE